MTQGMVISLEMRAIEMGNRGSKSAFASQRIKVILLLRVRTIKM